MKPIHTRLFVWIFWAVLQPESADAQYIYHDLVPDIYFNGEDGEVPVDINSDGIFDFVFCYYYNSNYSDLEIESTGSASFRGKGSFCETAKSLNQGNIIQSTDCWRIDVGSFDENWSAAGDQYLGIRIPSGNGYCYGWIRIEVLDDEFTWVKIKDLAWNTSVDSSIIAGNKGCNGLVTNPVITLSGGIISSSPASGYQWNYEGVPIPGETNASITPVDYGIYSVTATDTQNCVAESYALHYMDCNQVNHSISSLSATEVCEWGSASVVLDSSLLYGFQIKWIRCTKVDTHVTGTSYHTSYDSSIFIYAVVYDSVNLCSDTSNIINYILHPNPPAPVITQYGDTMFCSLLSYYQWYVNDQAVPGATNNYFVGDKNETLSISDTSAFGCVSWDDYYFDTCSYLTNHFSALGPTIFCQGDSVILSVNTGLNYQYWWYDGDGNNQIPGATGSTYTATESGTYRVTVDDAICYSKSWPIDVTAVAHPQPELFIVGDTLWCSPALVYQWYLDSVLIPDATNQFYVPIQEGNYQCELTNEVDCSALSSAFYYHPCNLYITLQHYPDVGTICNGDSVMLFANYGMGFFFQWYENDLAIPGANDSFFAATATGNYFYAIETPSLCGDSSEIFSLVVNPNPSPPLITFDGIYITCTPANSYQWFYNSLPVSGATSQQFTPIINGEYRVLITDLNGCTALSDSLLVIFTGMGVPGNDIVLWQSEDLLHYRLPNDNVASKLLVINNVGQVVSVFGIQENEGIISMSYLPKGMYVVIAISPDYRVICKIILE